MVGVAAQKGDRPPDPCPDGCPEPPVRDVSIGAGISCNEPTVQFSVKNGPDTWSDAAYSWSFGDGANSTSSAPIHTYREPGTYNVTVTITWPEGDVTTTSRTIRAPIECAGGQSLSEDESHPGAIPQDGYGAGSSMDSDGDGIRDGSDVCPSIRDADQADLDGDGQGDACDDDDDGDGMADGVDGCPRLADPMDRDLDNDGIPDLCDMDRDGDGVPDETDVCPTWPDPNQQDSDGDGVGDWCESYFAQPSSPTTRHKTVSIEQDPRAALLSQEARPSHAPNGLWLIGIGIAGAAVVLLVIALWRGRRDES